LPAIRHLQDRLWPVDHRALFGAALLAIPISTSGPEVCLCGTPDIKKLGRIGSIGHRITGRHPGAVNRHHGIGWEFVHVCIGDASRVAFVQVIL
jgi:hypothetical protein